MKKSYIVALAFAVIGMGVITAFSDEGQSPEQKEQMEKIQSMLESKLDSFRVIKEAECDAMALGMAVVKADSIMALPKKGITTKKSGGSSKPTTPTQVKEETTDPTKTKMSGDRSSSTEETKSKMSGQKQEVNTAKTKSKMGRKDSDGGN